MRPAEIFDKRASQEYYEKHNEIPQILDGFLKNIPSKGRILDAGCGPGVVVHHLLEQGYDAFGIDVSKDMLKLAREGGHGNRFFEQDMVSLPTPAQQYDGIWCKGAFPYVEKGGAAGVLQDFYDYLSPSGILYIDVPTERWKTKKLREWSGKKRASLGSINTYSIEEFYGMLEGKFEILQISSDDWLCALTRKVNH